eukprot:TRINITY_DN1837_c0_g1_i1.p1 TRINITY_DN1837_c0_g1~~TRINITY_DN1837_c0_g1_i1.p1  ORF type:complete len:309 (+),score=58.95 TRINITY_DN1837_c0_g1_i1:960-1886(+)
MSESLSVTLYQYGNYNLDIPSFCPLCMKIQMFLRVCEVPFTTELLSDHRYTPDGLPLITIDHGPAISGSANIIKYLNKIGYKLEGDEALTQEQVADMEAYIALVEDRLHKAQLFNWWVEVENYESFTHNAYANNRGFPFNWWIPRQMKKAITQQLEGSGLTSSRSLEVYEMADHCYKTLSAKLGRKQFFFGDKPTTLDCVVYGFLATQYAPQLQKDVLRKLIGSHDNLVDFINRMDDLYSHPTEVVHCNYKPIEKYIKSKKENDEKKLAVKHSSYAIIIGLVAVMIYSTVFNKFTRSLAQLQDDDDDE